jgi:NAD(P)H-dependent FMN reductase
MLNIGIIIGTTRDNRVSPQVAQYILNHAQQRQDAQYQIIDIKDFNLPPYNEPVPALFSTDYQTPQAKAWSEAIKALDGLIFITAEYNRGVTAPLKNALDYLYPEFANKAAGIVSFGSSGGKSAAHALREILIGLEVATVKAQPGFNLFTDFKDMREFTPNSLHDSSINDLFNQLEPWAKALHSLRHKAG